MLLSGYYRNGHARQDYGCGPCASIKRYYTISCERVEAKSNPLSRLRLFLLLLCVSILVLQTGLLHAAEYKLDAALVVAQTTGSQQPAAGKDESASEQEKVSPEEKMRRRFPQPVKVGDLIGLPVLDWDDVTIGHVRHVVRTPQGKIQLVVTYGGLFGWGRRLVPVPIEVVAILARQLAALDMSRAEFDKAPTWSGSQATPVAPNEVIQIAITRR
jgi:PRC-barrel domain protein